MVRVLLSVVQFRINARYVEGKPPFIAIELDHSDSGREGCAVSTLTVTSEPKDWRGATQVGCCSLAAVPYHSGMFASHGPTTERLKHTFSGLAAHLQKRWLRTAGSWSLIASALPPPTRCNGNVRRILEGRRLKSHFCSQSK